PEPLRVMVFAGGLMLCEGPALTTGSLAAPVMVVASVTSAEGDPPPETVAVFTCGEVALLNTFTVTVIAGYDAPAARTSLREQLLDVQVQPAPVIDTRVMPGGMTSSTVTVPFVDVVAAAFDTVRV